jgi:hypothetical protein
MAFPFDFSGKFISVEHPEYSFRQIDFYHLRDFLKRKYSTVHSERNQCQFTFRHVFGFLDFNIKILFDKNRLTYKIDMMPVFLSLIIILFFSLFVGRGSIIMSLIFGGGLFLLVYFFSLLILNGMTRRVLEEFVLNDVKRLEKSVIQPVCMHCGRKIPKGKTVCGYCENVQDKNKGIQINYSYKSDRS